MKNNLGDYTCGYLSVCCTTIFCWLIRYDYCGLPETQGQALMRDLEGRVADGSLRQQQFSFVEGAVTTSFTVVTVDNFQYIDPVDDTVLEKQVRLVCY